MVPVHFDRNPEVMPNSYLHSFCIRPFITADFMTGIAAIPGVHIPEKVSNLNIFSDKTLLLFLTEYYGDGERNLQTCKWMLSSDD